MLLMLNGYNIYGAQHGDLLPTKYIMNKFDYSLFLLPEPHVSHC